jgi:DNA repair protein RecO (recombination protein O)
MEIQKTTGIVLYSRHIGEADMLCRIYTRDHGKRSFIFKGIKKSKSRSHAVTEPGTIADILYYFHDNREFQVINEFKIQAHYPEIRSQLDKILHLYYMLEIIDKTTGFNDPNTSIYNLISAGIEMLSQTDYVENLSVFFTLHLLRTHGTLPDFTRCKICGKKNYSPFTIDTGDFLTVCSLCRPVKGGSRILLSAETADYIIQSLEKKFNTIPNKQYDAGNLLHLLFYLSLFIENYFHIEIKSKGMLFAEKK